MGSGRRPDRRYGSVMSATTSNARVVGPQGEMELARGLVGLGGMTS